MTKKSQVLQDVSAAVRVLSEDFPHLKKLGSVFLSKWADRTVVVEFDVPASVRAQDITSSLKKVGVHAGEARILGDTKMNVHTFHAVVKSTQDTATVYQGVGNWIRSSLCVDPLKIRLSVEQV